MAFVPTPTAQEYLKSIEGQPLHGYIKLTVEFYGFTLDDVTEILIKSDEHHCHMTFRDGSYPNQIEFDY